MARKKKTLDEAPVCKKCDTRHWNVIPCAKAAELRARVRVAPIWRPREDAHNPGFGAVTDSASFSDLGKARKEVGFG